MVNETITEVCASMVKDFRIGQLQTIKRLKNIEPHLGQFKTNPGLMLI